MKNIDFKIIEKTPSNKKDVMEFLHAFPKHFVHGLFEEYANKDFDESDTMVAYYKGEIVGCLMFNNATKEFNWLATKKDTDFKRRDVAKLLFENFYKTIDKGEKVHLFVNTDDAYIPNMPDFSGKNFESARRFYESMGLEIKEENRVENKFGLGAHAYKVEWIVK